MAKPLEYNATLVGREDLTSALAIFKVRSDDETPPFLPGQYVTLGMNNEKNPDLGSVRRPMSIVSAPEEGQDLEFYIRYVNWPESDNPLTHLLWDANEGDRMFMRNKAVGRFTLTEAVGDDDTRIKIFVAAGTGLAPFIGMVRSAKLKDPSVDLSSYVVLHGASYPADLGYRRELEALSRDNNLHYYASVSRPDSAPDWIGDKGRVEDYFLPERFAELEGRLGLEPMGLTPKNGTIFICGLQGTISETIARSVSRGFVADNRKLRRDLEVPEDIPASLFYEQYDNTPVIDPDATELLTQMRLDLHQALGLG